LAPFSCFHIAAALISPQVHRIVETGTALSVCPLRWENVTRLVLVCNPAGTSAWCSLPFAVAAHLEPEILIVDDSGLLAGWAEAPFMFEPTGEIAPRGLSEFRQLKKMEGSFADYI
jgi:hypothetical protein